MSKEAEHRWVTLSVATKHIIVAGEAYVVRHVLKRPADQDLCVLFSSFTDDRLAKASAQTTISRTHTPQEVSAAIKFNNEILKAYIRSHT